MYLELCLVLSVILGMIIILTALYGRELYRLAVICMFIGYIAGLVYFTFFWGNRAGLSSFDYKVDFPIVKSLFALEYGSGVHTPFMNLCLFVPMGYLLPQTFKLKWWQVVLIGIGVTLSIELLQPTISRGAFQVNDLIENSIGTVVGLVLYAVTVSVRASHISSKSSAG